MFVLGVCCCVMMCVCCVCLLWCVLLWCVDWFDCFELSWCVCCLAFSVFRVCLVCLVCVGFGDDDVVMCLFWCDTCRLFCLV